MDDAASPRGDDREQQQRHPSSLPAIDGAMRSAISQAIVRIHAEHYGKGATQAKTYVWENLVVTVLRDVLTVAERTLIGVDRADTVRDVRTTFQFSLEPTFREAVERVTGRRVHSFMSQVDPGNGLGVEVFVLEPIDDEDRRRLSATAPRDRRRRARPRARRGRCGRRSGGARAPGPRRARPTARRRGGRPRGAGR